jgi:hypothetical protein
MTDWDQASSIEACTCSHPLDCYHDCHGHLCDPHQHVCSIEFHPDEGGFTPVGCAACTPGKDVPHLAGCLATISTAELSAPFAEDAVLGS